MQNQSTFAVHYQIAAVSASEAEQVAQNICVEQTVEMPLDSVPRHMLRNVAEFSSLEKTGENRWLAVIRYSGELIGKDPTQLLNVLFGNSSLQHGIKVIDVESSVLNEQLPGPAFGINGIRSLLAVQSRPLSSTALKPIGLSSPELAERAESFARGGVDIIKDDHGLTNQPSADFRTRVAAVAHAIRKGEQVSGKKTLYFPNITSGVGKVLDYYNEAVDLGADGVLLCPQLSGLETLCELAKKADLPVMAHPAFSGSFVIQESHGISAPLYFGKIWRAFGADAVIYPNARGRFSFDTDLCKSINLQCRAELGEIKPAFPVPGGGINRDSISRWLREYEKDTIFLIGGSLYQHPNGIEAAAREFQQTLEQHG